MLKLGDAASSLRTLQTHRWEVSKDKTRVASSDLNSGLPLNIDWLPAAAKELCISPDIRDYVITEIPIVAVDLPNRNMDCFPYEVMASYNQPQGRMTYATFIGKPTFEEHANTDPTKAKGVHFDARMQQGPNGLWHIVVLAGWDRTKDAKLTQGILNDTRTGYSMGAFVDYEKCSDPECDAMSATGNVQCQHMAGGANKGTILANGQLAYAVCGTTNFIETSRVADPAQYDAWDRWKQPWDVRTARTAAMHKPWLPSHRR